MSFVELHVGTLTDREMARFVGRSPCAIRKWRERNHISPTRTTARWVTSREAAALLGVSQQTITAWARGNKLPARRVPGGRWWLIDWEACQAMRCHSGMPVASWPP